MDEELLAGNSTVIGGNAVTGRHTTDLIKESTSFLTYGDSMDCIIALKC